MTSLYTDEQKAEAVELSGRIGVRAAADEFGCSPSMITIWRRQAGPDAPVRRTVVFPREVYDQLLDLTINHPETSLNTLVIDAIRERFARESQAS